jgi:hypothetical protein
VFQLIEGQDALRHLMQIGADDVGTGAQRVEHLARPGNERRRASRVESTGDIPGMGRHQPDFLDWHALTLGGHPVRFRSGIEPPDDIGRERLHRGVVEQSVETRIKDSHVEQGLIDVEDDYAALISSSRCRWLRGGDPALFRDDLRRRSHTS